MIIPVEDTSYRCKNCDSFSQCEYYHHRRPDSHICKEFRNDWRQRDVLNKISAEIEEMIAGCERSEEIIGDDFGVFALSAQAYLNVLKIIEKYKKESEDEK